MTPTDRFRLRFGPYRTPSFKYGDVVMDEARDCEVGPSHEGSAKFTALSSCNPERIRITAATTKKCAA